jgi:tetratricopeptide (TPR) repeat protein
MPTKKIAEILQTAGVEIDPRSLRQHFLVGAMLRRQQRYEEAVPFLERAAALPGASEQVLFELAIAQQESGRRRAAAGTLEQLLKRNPDAPDYLNFYGYLLAEDGRELERAREMIDRALEADPDNGAYIDSLGWVLYQQGDLEGALDQLIRAVNVLGDDPVVLEHLGDCLRDLGRIDEARRTYERALQAGATEERIEERLRGLDEMEAP